MASEPAGTTSSVSDGADPATTAVEQRVTTLQRNAAADPGTAAEQVWAWFTELKDRAGTDPTGADRELNELFRLGTPPSGLDGPSDGILVTTTTNLAFDPIARVITGMWMPWQGKRFDAAAGTGDNRVVKSATLPSKLLWPLYSMRDTEDGKLAFEFRTYVEAGKEDSDRQVMVIDYSGVEGNPRLIIRRIRDELVEIVPGAYLGKILYQGSKGHRRIGYFALRTPR